MIIKRGILTRYQDSRYEGKGEDSNEAASSIKRQAGARKKGQMSKRKIKYNYYILNTKYNNYINFFILEIIENFPGKTNGCIGIYTFILYINLEY